MAELLIRLKNNTNADPVKDRMCYKRGDVVVIMPDGHVWGRAEGLPDFAVIQTDRTVAQMEQYIAVHETSQTETQTLPLTVWTKMQARGDYGVFTLMPTEGLKRVQRTGPGGRQITTIFLSGAVLRPHTRRKWGVALRLLPLKKAGTITTTGRAAIPFTQLRIALKDKIRGVQA